MGKGSNDTQSTTQTTEYDPEVMKRMGTGYNAVAGMVAPFLKVPTNTIAGFNPDQTQAFKLARDVAQGTFTGSPVRSIAGAPTLATTTKATAAQVTPDAIQAAMNPFLQSVVTPTLDRMRREKNAAGADIGARAAASGSFGGSREAVQRALLDRSFVEGAATTVSQLMAQGYDQATATALANAQMKQQTELTNAGAANATSQFNATTGNDFALRAPTIEDGLANNDQQRKVAALQMLLGIGGQQQQLAQSSIDQPWTALQRLLAVTPNVSPSTTTATAPDNSPGFLQQLLGVGLTVGGMGTSGGGTLLGNALTGLSDRNDKTNIQKLGKDPETGQTMYAYDYKADVEAAKRDGTPMGFKRVGPMAQDHAKAGGMTKRIGGHLTMLLDT